MIRGYFQPADAESLRPYVSALLYIPEVDVSGMNTQFLIDTGASRSIIGDGDAARMVEDYGVDPAKLPEGTPSAGIGGVTETRTVEATLHFEDFPIAIDLNITILEPSDERPYGIPSLLGRDVLAHFALFIEERTRKVLLLEPAEADALGLE